MSLVFLLWFRLKLLLNKSLDFIFLPGFTFMFLYSTFHCCSQGGLSKINMCPWHKLRTPRKKSIRVVTLLLQLTAAPPTVCPVISYVKPPASSHRCTFSHHPVFVPCNLLCPECPFFVILPSSSCLGSNCSLR